MLHVRNARCPTRFLTLAATFLLIVTMFVLPGRARAQTLSEGDRAMWEQRLISIVPNGIEGARTTQALLLLDPNTSLELVTDAWPKIASPEVRLYLLNMLQEHPRVLDLLHLGATDVSLFVQNRALQALEMFSFENFAEDFGAYAAWHKSQSGRTLEETIRESCRAYVQSIAKTPEPLRTQRLTLLQRVAYNLGTSAHAAVRRRAMLAAGLPDALAVWVKDPSTAWTAFAILRTLKMDEAYLRQVVLPLAGANTEVNYRRQALGVLATPENRWAAEPVLKMFVKEYPDPEAENIGYALTQMGDPRVIPTFIAMIDTDRTPDGQRMLGNILNLITGNSSGLLHDGDWWRSWWTKNALRFPADVRALPIPQVTLRARPRAPSTVVGPEQHQIGGDIKRTYWLVSPTAFLHSQPARAGADAPPPAPPIGPPGVKASGEAHVPARAEGQAPGLLVVLPPDGNGANAALFWQEMEEKALKNRYLVAVAVAPRWLDTQTPLWITEDRLKQVKEAKFSVERFVAEIAADVASSHTIQPGKVFLHGAAESGPAVYACSLEETTPFKGFYILASAFKSAGLPPLSRAKNRRYLIQHSPDDKAAPYFMAAAAQKLLAEQGAVARLESYKGSHGYVFSDPAADPIGSAINWLEGSQK